MTFHIDKKHISTKSIYIHLKLMFQNSYLYLFTSYVNGKIKSERSCCIWITRLHNGSRLLRWLCLSLWSRVLSVSIFVSMWLIGPHLICKVLVIPLFNRTQGVSSQVFRITIVNLKRFMIFQLKLIKKGYVGYFSSLSGRQDNSKYNINLQLSA